jgi:hypothetical protein
MDLSELATNEEFLSVLHSATAMALREHDEGKLAALRNAVRNTALEPEANSDLHGMFLRLVEELTPAHMQILAFYKDPPLWVENGMAGVPPGARPAIPLLAAENPDVWQLFSSQLVNRGLLSSSRHTYPNAAAQEIRDQDIPIHSQLPGVSLTDFGRRFVAFVTGPADYAPVQNAISFLVKVRGDRHVAHANTVLRTPLVVRAVGPRDEAVAGATVTWLPTEADARVSEAQSVTNNDGLAQTTWTPGAKQGVQSVEVSYGSAMSTFTARVIASTPWTRMESGVFETLRDIWGTSATNVLAVGDHGTILRYDGEAWNPMISGTDVDLQRVWGMSATAVYASDNATTLLRFDGTEWRQVEFPPVPKRGYRLWVNSETSAMAIVTDAAESHTGSASIVSWDGTTWHVSLENAVWPGSVWMAPDGRAFVTSSDTNHDGYLFDGTKWQRSGLPYRTIAVEGKNFDDLFVTSNMLGNCCTLRHRGRSGIDWEASGLFSGRPAWFVSPDEVYVFQLFPEEAETNWLLVRLTPSSPAGSMDEELRGIAAWGAPEGDLFVVGKEGEIWRRST